MCSPALVVHAQRLAVDLATADYKHVRDSSHRGERLVRVTECAGDEDVPGDAVGLLGKGPGQRSRWIQTNISFAFTGSRLGTGLDVDVDAELVTGTKHNTTQHITTQHNAWVHSPPER